MLVEKRGQSRTPMRANAHALLILHDEKISAEFCRNVVLTFGKWFFWGVVP